MATTFTTDEASVLPPDADCPQLITPPHAHHDPNATATSAGVSAGIDLALALVGRRWGGELAREVAKRIEWEGVGQWPDSRLW